MITKFLELQVREQKPDRHVLDAADGMWEDLNRLASDEHTPVQEDNLLSWSSRSFWLYTTLSNVSLDGDEKRRPREERDYFHGWSANSP